MHASCETCTTSFYLRFALGCVRGAVSFINAALTHTSRPYCDLKTSKIAFFFRKSFGFLSNFHIYLADGPGLGSLVFSTFFLCPQYDPSSSMAFPLRLYCIPKATPGRSSVTQMRLCYVLCVLTATFVRRLSCDCTTTLLRGKDAIVAARTQ